MLNNKSLLSKYTIIFIVVIISIIYLTQIIGNLSYVNLFTLFSFFIIGILSIVNIVTSLNQKISLYKVHGYFFLTFMFLAPLYQYSIGYFPWGLQLNENDVLFSNLVIIVWLIIYMATYVLVKKKVRPSSDLKISNGFIFIAFLVTLIAAISVFIFSGSIDNLLFRGATDTTEVDQSFSLIMNNTVRTLPAIVSMLFFILFINEKKYNSILFIMLIITSIITIMVAFPTGMPRYQVAAVYLGIIIITLKRFINFDLILLIGIFIVFPLLNQFRYMSEGITNAISFEIVNFDSGHFDAYSMLIRTIHYIDLQGITYGYQLLGTLFFFIPRSIWPDKPMGSGYTIGESQGVFFLNISSPFISEAIINFGWLFILVPLILAFLTKKLDSSFENEKNKSSLINLYFPFFVGFFFFILRGDFLSSFAYTIGFMVPIILLFFYLKITKIIRY